MAMAWGCAEEHTAVEKPVDAILSRGFVGVCGRVCVDNFKAMEQEQGNSSQLNSGAPGVAFRSTWNIEMGWVRRDAGDAMFAIEQIK